MAYFVLEPRSFTVIYTAGLVAKGSIPLDMVTESMGLKKYVIEVLEEMGYEFKEDESEFENPFESGIVGNELDNIKDNS